MNLSFDVSIVGNYKSNSQIARVLTERWVESNVYCIRCGNENIISLKNNRPVADFMCPKCRNIYELKSKAGSLGKKVNDGAYSTMLERITSNSNPDFLFLSFDKIEESTFTLKDMYYFENELKMRHPENYHIRDKIRQQLQFARDKGLIEFISRGLYRKV